MLVGVLAADRRLVVPRIEAAMTSIATWDGARFLDLGCGSGFHLPRWASTASAVIGVEPHPDLAALARRRTRRLKNVSVEVGTAQALPVSDDSIDVMQARWAYFFGPGCEPGLAELDRVMARGATAFVIDNDSSRSTFGECRDLSFVDVHTDDVMAEVGHARRVNCPEVTASDD